jgi:hypothetical protein
LSRFETEHVRPRPGRTLIVGSYVTTGKTDRRALYPVALGVDMREGLGVDMVLNLEEQCDIGQFAHIECTYVLEHCRRPWLMAKSLERMLEPGGTIHVEVPFNWWPHAHPDDYFRMSLSGIRSLFTSIDWLAMVYDTHGGLQTHHKAIPMLKVEGHRYYARSMACGFGVKQ